MTDPRDTDQQLMQRSGRKAEAMALAQRKRVQLDPLQEMMGLPAPVWENQPESKASDGRCVIFSGAQRCGTAATHRAWIGCTVGEHLDFSDVCEAHGQMLDGSSTVYYCRRCWDAVHEISKAQVIKVERIEDVE